MPQFSLSALAAGTLLESAGMLLLFIGFLFVGSMVLPGRRVAGPELEGETRVYKLNGLALFLVTVTLGIVAQGFGWFSFSVLHTHFAALFVVANVFALAAAGWLYLRGARARSASGGDGRSFLMGSELNPTLFGVDLKMFSYRPSLIGLAVFNLSFAAVQFETHGGLTLAMAVYQAITFVYVFNYFQFEYGMVHTWDIIAERFGLGLVWGDYVLVPFFYCLAGWWLVDAPDALPPVAAVGIVLLAAFGFWLFRGANEQKHRFKQDPNVRIWGRPAETLDGRLLVSGFWGKGRHLNYTGEICVYFAFTLTTGFVSWVPFLVPAWLTGLLLHRSRRDDRRCRAKYGELWERYTERVRYSVLPFVP